MTPTTADNAIRDRLKALREQLSDARSRRTAAKKERDEAKESFAGTTIEGNITASPEFKAAENAVKNLGNIDDEIADLQQAEQGILQLLGDRAENNGRNGGDRPANLDGVPRLGWDGRRLLAESDAFNEAREAGVFNSAAHFGTVVLGEIANRDEAMAFLSGSGRMAMPALPGAAPGSVGTPAGVVPPDFRGIIPPHLRKLTLLDIIPTGTTDSNVVNYVQVTAIPQGAVETAELAVKPELGLTVLDQTAPVRTIAGWIKAARQALDDMAGLGSLINLLLPYEVRRRIEGQILAGDGIGQNLLGILNTTGIGAPAAVGGDNAADAILRAMTTVVLSDSDPNFVAVNPITWQNLLLMREGASDGSWKGEYLYGGPGMMAAPTIWGMLITPSRIIPTSTALTGDNMACTLLVREGVNVKTSDSDQDDFVRNRVTILAEARVAFPVWRPSGFAVATIS